MKHKLCKLFFWNTPAKGVFFALTFFIVCSSLWFTFYQTLWLSDCGLVMLNNMSDSYEREIQVWAVIQLLITLYSLAVFLRAVWRLIGNCRWHHDYRPLCCVFPAMAVWVAGGLFCLVPLFCLLNVLRSYGGVFYSSSLPAWVAPFANLPAGWWGAAYLVAVLCMVIGGYFMVKGFAQGEGKHLHDVVSKPGVALWGVFGIAYVVFLVMAMVQSRQVAQTRSVVEQRFGHPLTADGLREFYQQQGVVDGDFWNRLDENKLPSELAIGDKVLKYWNWQLPEQLTPDFEAAFDATCKANEKSILELEKNFDSIPPLPFYEFAPGRLVSQMLKPLQTCRRIENLELARMRVALKRKDKNEAMSAYQRIANCTANLQYAPFLIGGLVWLSAENMRLDAMERLLESHLLTEEDLQCLAAELVALEEQVPVIHQHSMYAEAVFSQDVLWGLETGKAEDVNVAFAQLRWFYPQLWLQAALDKEQMLKVYLAEDFNSMDYIKHNAYILSRMLTPALKPSGNKFHGLTARARAMQALLKAEAYRRENGDFPETMSDLPSDPFTGKPMLYRYGIAEISEYVLKVNEDEEPCETYELEPQTKQAKVVQVWSAGPNGVDNGGVNKGLISDKDDPCARIRLK
ncbi:MAG: hypothetical protein K6G44_07670 [Lentisphaeria bacterium]|nr:hypothetical protein [Lentisphaeria bacterium]